MREARAGDRYLLCSDGLSDPVSDETILEALQIPDVAESAYRLIELALRGGGPDNVTVVVADVVDYDYGQTQPILAGAVSGEEDQLTPAQHLRRPGFGDQPPQRGRQTRCAARGAGQADRGGRMAADVHCRHAGGAAGARGPGHRARHHPQQLLRRRIQRHGVDHAGNSRVAAGHVPARALFGGLPERPQRAIPDQLQPIRRSPRLPD